METSIFSAALDFLRDGRDRHLGHLQPLVCHIDRLDSDLATFATKARDSRASCRRSVSLLFEEFYVLSDNKDTQERASFSPPTKEFVVFIKLHSCDPFLEPL